jgi:hypothetical protein
MAHTLTLSVLTLTGESLEVFDVLSHDEATRLFLVKADTLQSFDLIVDWFRSGEQTATLTRDGARYTFKYKEEE